MIERFTLQPPVWGDIQAQHLRPNMTTLIDNRQLVVLYAAASEKFAGMTDIILGTHRKVTRSQQTFLRVPQRTILQYKK